MIYLLEMVRPRGVEPPPFAGQRPQHCASTSSAMTAILAEYIISLIF